jgi:replicative DNA helicase
MKDSALMQGVEVTIIGTLAAHPETFRQVREVLKPEMFISEQGVSIATKLWGATQGGKWNKNLFAASLEKYEAANIDMAMKAADTDNLGTAAELLRAQWEQGIYKQALADAALNYESFESWKEADERMNEARRLIMQTSGGRAESPQVIIEDITQDIIDGIRGKKEYCGIHTGFPDLDYLTGGWQPGQQIILAARPGQGKTRLGVQFAYAAAKAGAPVVFYSREIMARQIYRYVLSFMSGVPVSHMKSYSLDTNSIDEIGRAADMLKAMPLYVVDDTPTVEDVRYSMLEMAAHKGAKLFVVDYVQLLSSSATKRSDNRNNELAHISRTLKLTAMQTNAANILLAQLNRETEKRAGKRPQLSDLRDSGALEADADVVMFPYDPAKMNMEGQGELIVEKQRDGKTGSIAVDWKEPGFFYPGSPEPEISFTEPAPRPDYLNGIKPSQMTDETYVPF